MRSDTVVPPPRHLDVSPIKAKKLKMAVGCTCELCGDTFAFHDLELHYIHVEKSIDSHEVTKLSKRLLILCSRCHQDIHLYRCSIAEERGLIRHRMRKTMQAMVKILRYRPKPIVPPESTDIDRIHDEIAHAHWGWGT